MKGFLHFIRTQGVVGLAVGFVIGTAAQQFVSALSKDLLNPIVGLALGRFENLASASTTVAGATFGWGHVLSELLNLILIAFVVYIAVTYLRAKDLDAPKDSDNK